MHNNKLYILWDNSHIWGLLALHCVKAMQIPFKLVKAEEISQGILSGKSSCMLLVPGGSARLKAKSLGEKGKNAIKNFVASGNHYLGFCGGAGLALSHSEGLALCPWTRASYANKWQHLISGHIITKLSEHELCPTNFNAIHNQEKIHNDLDSNNNLHKLCAKHVFSLNIKDVQCAEAKDNLLAATKYEHIYDDIILPVWWPGCFQNKYDENIEILARYQAPANDMWIADILLSSLPTSIFKEWKARYDLDFDPAFLSEQVCVLHGKYAKGSYTLSYSHLETPNSAYANHWLAHLFSKLIDLDPAISVTPSWKIEDEKIAWENTAANKEIFTIRDNIQKLICLGEAHNLLFKRNDWLWGWRSGIPGIALNNLNTAVHVALSQMPTKKSMLYWQEHRVTFKKNMEIFTEATEKYLLDERLATTLSSTVPEIINRTHLNNQRTAIFGSPMRAGGLYQEILDVLEQIIFLQA